MKRSRRLNPAAMRNWTHGSIRGAAAMASVGLERILASDTATPAAKRLAGELLPRIVDLREALKEMVP